jgi:deoxyadenosine/deoxycytidine kinase
MKDHKGKYIALEGNIGAGKTTLANKLAEQLNARLVLEEFNENPFLENFYQDANRYAFQVEMAFLADRYHQLTHLHSTADMFQPLLVADYAPFKSLIFAQNNLNETEFKLYRDFWSMSLGRQKKPDLVIYLNRTLESLQRNIARRGRSFEVNIDPNYLKDIGQRYHWYLNHQLGGKWMSLDADNYDVVNSQADLNELTDLILSKLEE